MRVNSTVEMENSKDYPQIGNTQTAGNLCTSCLQENDFGAVYCRHCNAALGLTENPDPLQRLSHEGVVYSKAVEGKPKLVVLIGVWLMFAPVFVVSAFSAVSLIFEGEGGSLSFVLFWVLVVSAFFSLTMVYKVTKNYYKSREKENL